MRPRLRRRPLAAALRLLPAAALIGGAALLLRQWERENVGAVEAPCPYEDEGGEGLAFFEGGWYARREGLETVLLIGVDKDSQGRGQGDYEQSDFLMLLVLDRGAGRCTAIQIDRDTMVQYSELADDGTPIRTVTGQAALAHAYGGTGRIRCENVARALSAFLYGAPIDHYVSLNMDGVMALNDLAGGVELVAMDDFPDGTPGGGIRRGQAVTLRGQQALAYVRTRYGMEDTSNRRRMERQRQYLGALQERLAEREREDGGFALEAVLELGPYMVSDCTAEQLSRLASEAGELVAGGILTPEGEAVMGEGMHMEFHADEGKLQELVIGVFYEPADGG